MNKNESILWPLKLAKSATASADFLVFFLQFFRCSNVSVGTNVGRTVKSSPNAESTVGKFLKWFAASLEVSPSFFYMLVILNLPRGLLSLTSMHLPVFSGIGVLTWFVFLQGKTVCPLPRTQTSLPRLKFACKGRRKGENGGVVASPIIFLFSIVPCTSSSVNRVPLAFSLASVWKTRNMRRRQICPLKNWNVPQKIADWGRLSFYSEILDQTLRTRVVT